MKSKLESPGQVLQTERLEMRMYRDEDFEFLCSLLSDPQVVRFIGDGEIRSRSQAYEFLYWIYRAYKEAPETGLRLLVRSEDGKPVGHAGLVRQTVDGTEELEIGYWIAPHYWGQGYAKEAAASIRDYGIKRLGRKRFVSLIQPENKASRKVAESIGMGFEKAVAIGSKEVFVYSLDVLETMEQEGQAKGN